MMITDEGCSYPFSLIKNGYFWSITEPNYVEDSYYNFSSTILLILHL